MDTIEATETPTPERTRGWAAALATLLAGVWVWIALWGMAAGVLGALWPGADAWVITSGSMEPVLSAGDLVLTSPPEADVAYDAPTVITFFDGDRFVTHRIVEVVDGAYRTQGDANADPDSALVDPADVEGIGRLVVPWVALPIHWWRLGQWWWTLLGLASVAGGWWIMRRALPDPDPDDGGDDDGNGDGNGDGGLTRSAAMFGVLAVALSVVAVTAVAFFSAQTSEAGVVSAAVDFGRGPYDEMILADGPAAYWRLGEVASGGGAVFTDRFAPFRGWSANPEGGDLVRATPPVRSPGSGGPAGHKVTNNDPAGGRKEIGFVADDFTLRAWVLRPTPFAGGQFDRISIETAGGNGYGFAFNHAGDQISIERRTNGSPVADSGGVAIPDQLDAWYLAELTKAGPNLTLTVFDSELAPLARQTWSDTLHGGGFTDVVVRGGHEYFVDDIEVVQGAAGLTIAVDASGNGNDGTYLAPVSSAPGLIADPADDGSIDFDGGGVAVPDSSDINVGGRDARTLSLWFEAVPGGRQLIYEEGGTVNGLNAYLDGTTLHARSWNSDWSPSELQVTTTVPPGRHHLGMVLDAVGDTLDVYLDGVLVGTATKTDGRDWDSHPDDTGIGRVNGSTKFHDGNSSAPTPFAARIDEVAVFNTALAPAQVIEHWANGSG